MKRTAAGVPEPLSLAASLLPFALAVAFCISGDLTAEEARFFRNSAKQAGLNGRKSTRCIFADLNGDGWADVIMDRQYVLISTPRPGGGRVFKDASEAWGLEACCTGPKGYSVPSILIAGDVDNDGDPDLFAGYSLELEKPRHAKGDGLPVTEGDRLVMEKKDPGLRNRILINQNGRFVLRPDSGVGLAPETTCAATFFDFDLDGCLDLFIGNWYRYYGQSLEAYPDRLYRGDGAGRFIEVTDRAGMLTVGSPGYRNSSKPTYGAAHCDWNNDGYPDLLVAVYGRQWNFLWQNDGCGGFKDRAADTGFDGDDIRHGKYPSRISRAAEAPFRANGNSFDAAPRDFDNDGDVDVFLAEITHWWAGDSSDRSCLLVNLGPEKNFAFDRDLSRIVRKAEEVTNWNHGDLSAAWIDFDNDGLADLLLGSSDYPDEQFLRLFRQDGDHRFCDVTDQAGFSWRNPTGMTVADVDRDGDLDVLVGNNNVRLAKEQHQGRVLEAALFENQLSNGMGFVSLGLEGRGRGGANRSAIGARVWVSAGGIVQMQEVHGGGGHGGRQNWPVLHFGLAKAKSVDWIRVRWSDRARTMQTVNNLKTNGFYRWKEGQAPVSVWEGPRKDREEKKGAPKEDTQEEEFSQR